METRSNVMNWKAKASALTPLLGFAETGGWGGENGILARIFELVPVRAKFAVEFGQRTIGAGTIAKLIEQRGWGALYMDREAPAPTVVKPVAEGRSITLARESVTPSNFNALLAKYAVPDDFDCLVIDIDGIDYWVWHVLAPTSRPSLVVIEFNAHVALGVEATIHNDEAWAYRPSKNYGASFSALCALAAAKGYRLIHVHGPWNLYFLRNDIEFPAELCIKSPLEPADLALLTQTDAFYDTFCGGGKRPSWAAAPAPDVSIAPWEIIAGPMESKRVDLEGIPLQVLADKQDGNWYLQRKTFEEKASLLYRFIRDEGFDNFIDVGANVGFVSILACRASARLRIVSIEPDPRLVRLIQRNFEANGVESATVVNAIVGDRSAPGTGFSLNPNSTLDNRVTHLKWPQIQVPMLRLDDLLAGLKVAGKTFFKIDTQGFELKVLRGLEATLAGTDDWVLKMEFAPDWLRSQGSDPESVLDHLQSRYEFVEFAERISFGTPGFDALFATPIRVSQHAEFIRHVVSLNKNGLGWVDLLVRPHGAASRPA